MALPQQDQLAPARSNLAHWSGCVPTNLGLAKDCRPTAGTPQPLFVRLRNWAAAFFIPFDFFSFTFPEPSARNSTGIFPANSYHSRGPSESMISVDMEI